jgi:cohesin loading factor subunit SCC2
VAASKLGEEYSKHIKAYYTRYYRRMLPADELNDADDIGDIEDKDGKGKGPVNKQEDEDEDNSEDIDVDTREGAFRLLSDTRALAETTLQITEAPTALHSVPIPNLINLLKILLAVVDQGHDKHIEEEDEEDAAHVQQVQAATEAAALALRIMTIPNAPQQVFNEELIDLILDMTRFHLLHNVYPFYDARFRAAHRPDLNKDNNDGGSGGDVNDEGGPSKKRKLGGKKATKSSALKKAAIKSPAVLKSIVDRLHTVVGLIAELLPAVRLQPACLPPLLRAASGALTVANEAVLLVQARSISLLSAAFCCYTDLRRTLFDEFFVHVMPYLTLNGSNINSLKYVASPDGSVCIHMVSAAVLQMIQASVDLPDMDAPPDSFTQCYAPAARYGDYFWKLCFEKLPKAGRTESDQDYKALVDIILKDLIYVQHFPEWPAASVLLLRFVSEINPEHGATATATAAAAAAAANDGSNEGGLLHSDAAVRQMFVDFLGALASCFFSDELIAEDDEDWVNATAAENDFSDATEAIRSLLLRYLADASHRSDLTLSAARRFTLSKSLAEEATELRKNDASDDELKELLLKYRALREELELLTYADGLTGEDSVRLMRAANRATYKTVRFVLLQWITDATDPRSQTAPTVRAKAIKSLSEVVQADTAILNASPVQVAIDRALGDDAISVREAAVALLGRHIQGNTDLTLQLFPTLVKASMDSGTSVRKVAIKLLWECCIKVSGFPKAAEAARHVLLRAADPEESIQDWVAKVFHSLWFTSKLEDGTTTGTGGVNAVVERRASDRAEQLANIALSVYEAGGRGIHLPLDSTHPLVTVLRSALSWGSKGDLGKERKAGREISAALLQYVLQCAEYDGDGDDPEVAFPYLLSLHAFAVTEIALCMPEKDPSRLVRTLSPYLKAGNASGNNGGTKDSQRRAAERLLCILALIDSSLINTGNSSTTGHGTNAATLLADPTTAGEMVEDLANLINRHTFTQVMTAAVKCLCTLASYHQGAAQKLASLTAVYHGWLVAPPPGRKHPPQHVARFLFILGQLCRYGADSIERVAATILQAQSKTAHGDNNNNNNAGVVVVTMQHCLAAFIARCNTKEDLKVQENALGALGALAIARPAILVSDNSRAKALMKATLRPNAPEALKLKGLSNLIEILRAESEALVTRQIEEGGGLKGGKGGSGRGGGLIAATTRITANGGGGGGAIPTHNGSRDALSQGSTILQDNWSLVLDLALDTTPSSSSLIGAGAGQQQSPATSALLLQSGSAVRRRALDLIEMVLRDGLVGPWTAISTLVVLCTDPAAEDVRGRAIKCLCTLVEKHARYFDAEKLADGVVTSKYFHSALASAQQQQQQQQQELKQQGELLSASVSATAAAGGMQFVASKPPRAAMIGLRAVYTHLIQPNRQLRGQFIRSLLRRFKNACDLPVRTGKVAAPAIGLINNKNSEGEEKKDQQQKQQVVDVELLCYLSSILSALPLSRGDEVCALVQEINGLLSTCCEDVKHELRQALESCRKEKNSVNGISNGDGDGNSDDDGKSGGGGAHPAISGISEPLTDGIGAVAATATKTKLRVMNNIAGCQCRASLALSYLLLLKEYMKARYAVNAERVAGYASAGDRRRQEERIPVVALDGAPLLLSKLDLQAPVDFAKAVEQYKVFRQLVKRDADDYDHLLVAGRKDKGEGEGDESSHDHGHGSGGNEDSDGSGGGSGGVASEGGNAGGTPGWVAEMGNKGGKKGGGNGNGSKPSTRGKRTATTTTTNKKKKRAAAATAASGGGGSRRSKRGASSEDSSDEDYNPKKRLAL